jgi:hypothetical protein
VAWRVLSDGSGRVLRAANPRFAAANVNCRLLADDSIERVMAELTKLTAGELSFVDQPIGKPAWMPEFDYWLTGSRSLAS